MACLNGWFDGQPGPGYSGAGLNFFMGCDVLARRVFIILLVLLFSLSLCVSASSGSVVYGETVEQGTGDKSPDNPYSLTGYLPEEFRFSGTIYGVPLNEPLYGDGIVNDEYDAKIGVEVRRWKCLVLNGSENWGLSKTESGNFRYYFLRLDSVDYTSLSQVSCTHWSSIAPGQTWQDKTGITLSLSGSDKNLWIYDDRFAKADLPTFKSFLAAQFDAGTPLTVVYQLAEPEVIQHEPVVLGKYMSESIFESSWDDIGQFDMSNSVILLDEISLFADNRDYKNFSHRLKQFFILHRHYHCDIVWFTQQYDGVDRKIRELTTCLYYVRSAGMFSYAVRIDRFIFVQKEQKDIKVGFKITGFIRALFAFLNGSVKLCFRPRYYKYFDSFDAPLLPQKEFSVFTVIDAS